MSDLIDPTPLYNFVVKIQDAEVGWFTECSGLTVEREPIPQPEGGVNDYVAQLPGPISYSKLTLKRGLADNVLWQWFAQGLYDGKVERRHVTITLLNPDRTEAHHWDMTNAYPVRWSATELQSESAQVMVETLELASGGGSEQALVQRSVNDGIAAMPAVSAAAGEIDVALLAGKVYALLKQELIIERERLCRRWSR